MENQKAGKRKLIAASIFDAFGNSAQLDGPLSWSVDPSRGSLEIAANSLSAVFTANGVLGPVAIQISGMSGGNPVSKQVDINVIAGDAASISVSFQDL